MTNEELRNELNAVNDDLEKARKQIDLAEIYNNVINSSYFTQARLEIKAARKRITAMMPPKAAQ